MKKLSVLIITFFLIGCSTVVPVKRKFPPLNPELSDPCPELNTVPENNASLSLMLDIVADNYAEYHTCRNKVDGWLKWYKEQKKIFESANK